MKYVEDFVMMLFKHRDKEKINLEIRSSEILDLNGIDPVLVSFIPKGLGELYSLVNGFKITEPRKFELLEPSKLILLDNRYLVFAVFNETEMVCFDTDQLNDASEFNIISYDNKFLITLTFGSFLMNKVWAWVNRGRKVWDKEKYPE